MEKHTEDQELDFLQLFKILYINKKAVIIFTAVFIVFGLFYVFTATPVYTAKTSILPSEEYSNNSNMGSLQGLTNMLPFASMQQSDGITAVIPDIVKSKNLIYSLLKKSFSENGNDSGLSLLEIINVKGDSEEEKLERAFEKLLKVIDAHHDNATDLITITVDSDKSWLAADLCNKLVEMLNDFAIKYNAGSASYARRFVEEQLVTQKDSLDAIVEVLTEFKKSNVNYLESQDLQAEFLKLEMERRAREEVWIEYRRQYELTRLQEVKDTPVLNILDRAIIPVRPSKPKKLLILAIATVFGFISGCVTAVISYRSTQTKRA